LTRFADAYGAAIADPVAALERKNWKIRDEDAVWVATCHDHRAGRLESLVRGHSLEALFKALTPRVLGMPRPCPICEAQEIQRTDTLASERDKEPAPHRCS
jgi:hypothetical protein